MLFELTADFQVWEQTFHNSWGRSHVGPGDLVETQWASSRQVCGIIFFKPSENAVPTEEVFALVLHWIKEHTEADTADKVLLDCLVKSR